MVMPTCFNDVDSLYYDLIDNLLDYGVNSADRTGVGTRRLFGLSFCLDAGKKLLVPTFKPVNIKAVMAEFWCFTNGITDVDELKKFGCNWWEANLQDANKRWGTPNNRNLGPVYGAQWVKPYICGAEVEGQTYHDPQGYQVPVWTDQLTNLITTIKENPTDRRMYVTAWNPEDFEAMALPPCYHGFQVFVEDGYLHLMWHMRSCDVILGLPHDILFHQFLMMALAAECGLKVGYMTVTLGDTHIYNNAMEAAETFYNRIRSVRAGGYKPALPELYSDLVGFRSISPASLEQGRLFYGEYNPMPNIKVKMAV